jgi:threonine aldolase
MSEHLDLRSDTVTRPTPGMRRAIAEAVVGDDVFGDDPTVQLLEQRTAELLGKRASLFMASGMMSNQVAIACLTRPGDEVLLEASSHSYLYEAGGPAVISGVQLRPIPGERGLISAERLRANLRPRDVHFPEAKVIVFENTHNRSGGRVLSLERMRETALVAREAGLQIHLDGARLWNAAVASGIAESRYAELADTVSVCFSKGMGAPVGSVLAADSDTIARARRVRKRLGGGMRQVGILAAAALYSLDHNRERLLEDHRRARSLAAGLAEIAGLRVDLDAVETNIIIIELEQGSAQEWMEELERIGVLVVPFGPSTLRAVTHLDIGDEDLTRAIEAFRDVAGRR